MVAEADRPEPTQELIDLFTDLGPWNQQDVLKLIRIKLEASLTTLRPPNAYEWNRLSEWQKKKIYYAVLFARIKFDAKRYIHSRLPHWIRKFVG